MSSTRVLVTGIATVATGAACMAQRGAESRTVGQQRSGKARHAQQVLAGRVHTFPARILAVVTIAARGPFLRCNEVASTQLLS